MYKRRAESSIENEGQNGFLGEDHYDLVQLLLGIADGTMSIGRR
jgi:hypothetical protein